MFRKKISTLERSLKAAGVDLNAPLGMLLLNKMFDHGHETRKVIINKNRVSHFEVLALMYETDGSPKYHDWIGDIELTQVANNWVVCVWGNDGPFDSSWHNETVYSKYDLFGELISDV